MIDTDDKINLILGDCTKVYKKIPQNSVDFIFADIPYGTTITRWDNVIPFPQMWELINWVRKDTTIIVLMGTQPFTSHLILSNEGLFKYSLVWDKGRGTEPQLANIRPMKSHEDLVVFYERPGTYNPIKTPRREYYYRSFKGQDANRKDGKGLNIFRSDRPDGKIYTDKFPVSIISIPIGSKKHHPAEKPIGLAEYLIKTYSNEHDLVLDFTMGSGTTGVAAMWTNRRFVGIELREDYYKIAEKRIGDTTRDLCWFVDKEA